MLVKISFETVKEVTGHDFILEKKISICIFWIEWTHVTKSFRMPVNAEVV